MSTKLSAVVAVIENVWLPVMRNELGIDRKDELGKVVEPGYAHVQEIAPPEDVVLSLMFSFRPWHKMNASEDDEAAFIVARLELAPPALARGTVEVTDIIDAEINALLNDLKDLSAKHWGSV